MWGNGRKKNKAIRKWKSRHLTTTNDGNEQRGQSQSIFINSDIINEKKKQTSIIEYKHYTHRKRGIVVFRFPFRLYWVSYTSGSDYERRFLSFFYDVLVELVECASQEYLYERSEIVAR